MRRRLLFWVIGLLTSPAWAQSPPPDLRSQDGAACKGCLGYSFGGPWAEARNTHGSRRICVTSVRSSAFGEQV